MILGLVFALIIGAPRLDSRSTESQATKQQAHDEYEDTSNQPFASMNWPGEFTQKPTPVPSCRKIAGVFAKELPPAWTSGSIRQRVAHAEYESVRNWRSCIPNERRSKTDPFERAACEKPTSLPSRGPRPRSLLQSCPSPRGQK